MKIYRGRREKIGSYPPEPYISVEIDCGFPENFEKLMLQKSLKVRNHSPTGFEWGYGGSGPHQLALALLMDATGDNTVAEKFYHDFLLSHVMQWGRGDDDSWSISDDYIRAWIKNRNS